MKWTGLNELRETFLSFFESKGHLRLKSYPLIPQNDNSLLLINSGMAPMKKYFTGEITPPSKRVTTCQKCIRTPDIERVGKTSRHGTYFEMLGNFSFGDYFKHEATAWAWEFCTKVMEMPVDLLYVSIYEEDYEAFEIWTKEVGVDPKRIVRMGKEDNFWDHGSGPCGPCSEIYFDRGEKHGCGSDDCFVGCECDRFVEFWNLVFTQFDNDGNNNYTPLAKPNIDTGMGLERLACIMQDVNTLFEVDTIANIMKHVSRIAKVNYGENEKTDVSLRVITDHIRSTTFMVADGVMPSNEGRGYVLRRLLRRAARHGKLLDIKGAFLSEICDTVIDENKDAYPELIEKKEFIEKLIANEEQAFGKTIDQGLNLLTQQIAELKENQLSGEAAFKLYDTYGFPLDLTKDILEEKGIAVNEDEFNNLMKEQKERARNARKSSEGSAWESGDSLLESVSPTNFVGYDKFWENSNILAIICDNELLSSVTKGSNAVFVVNSTPFYAESGGQVGDTGLILSDNAEFEVTNTTKNDNGIYLHSGTVKKGTFNINDSVIAKVDSEKRLSIMRNHTAAHLLQCALRKVLGNHVEQAGQFVDSQRLRFDFTHFSALTNNELKQVEDIVNNEILSNYKVQNELVTLKDAKAKGAMALFGEKYEDNVRMVTAGESIELCGGTHAEFTGNLGLFHIISEGSVASGVRRIEAITGTFIIDFINEQNNVIAKASETLKASNAMELLIKANQTINELKQVKGELEALQSKVAAQKAGSLLSQAKEVNGVKIVTTLIENALPENLRKMCDDFKSKDDNIIAVIAGTSNDCVNFACCCGKQAVAKGAHAGNIVRKVAEITGGKGGGRPDSANAGAKDLSKVNDALNQVVEIVSTMLNRS